MTTAKEIRNLCALPPLLSVPGHTMRHTFNAKQRPVSSLAFIAWAGDALLSTAVRLLMHAISLHSGGAHACGRAAGLRILSALLLCTTVVTAQNASPDMQFPRANILFSSIGHGWARYGDSMLSMGDVNRDGIPDIFINAYMTLPWAYLVFGTRPGILDRVSYMRLEGFGTLAKGDVNGDGLPDLLSQSNGTTITMYPGCSTCPLTIDTVFAWRVHPDTAGGNNDFGRYMAVGDLNGDGREDMAIADPYWHLPSQLGAGKIFIYFGGSAKFPSADMTATIQIARHVYGENGLAVADVTGDGYKDLVIGTEVYGTNSRYSYIDVYFGGPGFTCDPSKPSQRFGKEVIPYWKGEFSLHAKNILDMNHDGIGDFYVSVDRYGYIYHGGPGGIHTVPDRVLAVPDSVNYCFYPEAFDIGDINGDGFDDFLLSAHTMFTPAFAFIYLGSPSGMESYPAATAWPPNGEEAFADAAIDLGDMDGDGIRDFAASYNGWGQAPGFVLYAGKRWKLTPVEAIPFPHSSTMTAYPNPFRSTTTLRYNGLPPNPSEMSVYDVYGRMIRKLPLVELPAEEKRAVWDGRDCNGAAVPRGVYFCILETHRGLFTARVMKE